MIDVKLVGQDRYRVTFKIQCIIGCEVLAPLSEIQVTSDGDSLIVVCPMCGQTFRGMTMKEGGDQ